MLKLNLIFSLPRLTRLFLLLTLATSSFTAAAKETVSIENAWVRATAPGQDVGAAYMTFASKQDVTLIRIESDATKSVEIHSMSMQNGVMKMRMLDTLPIKAGKPYTLEPGGFHLMLFDLKKPLTAGQHVNFELTFKSGNAEFKQQIKAPVKAPGSDESGGTDHSHHH
ncbi:copper chaperone PCu(A)C [Methylotenera sp. G11]|uniref:copper chaperone PCu(A)C n=1 Tax=Methylotenera sp. G11 TaxID=1506585 RepID=UPI000646BA75|nr:copper chaperone PCu(A)C [Methylotenera sp. G11]